MSSFFTLDIESNEKIHDAQNLQDFSELVSKWSQDEPVQYFLDEYYSNRPNPENSNDSGQEEEAKECHSVQEGREGVSVLQVHKDEESLVFDKTPHNQEKKDLEQVQDQEKSQPLISQTSGNGQKGAGIPTLFCKQEQQDASQQQNIAPAQKLDSSNKEAGQSPPSTQLNKPNVVQFPTISQSQYLNTSNSLFARPNISSNSFTQKEHESEQAGDKNIQSGPLFTPISMFGNKQNTTTASLFSSTPQQPKLQASAEEQKSPAQKQQLQSTVKNPPQDPPKSHEFQHSQIYSLCESIFTSKLSSSSCFLDKSSLQEVMSNMSEDLNVSNVDESRVDDVLKELDLDQLSYSLKEAQLVADAVFRGKREDGEEENQDALNV